MGVSCWELLGSVVVTDEEAQKPAPRAFLEVVVQKWSKYMRRGLLVEATNIIVQRHTISL